MEFIDGEIILCLMFSMFSLLGPVCLPRKVGLRNVSEIHTLGMFNATTTPTARRAPYGPGSRDKKRSNEFTNSMVLLRNPFSSRSESIFHWRAI